MLGGAGVLKVRLCFQQVCRTIEKELTRPVVRFPNRSCEMIICDRLTKISRRRDRVVSLHASIVPENHDVIGLGR